MKLNQHFRQKPRVKKRGRIVCRMEEDGMKEGMVVLIEMKGIQNQDKGLLGESVRWVVSEGDRY